MSQQQCNECGVTAARYEGSEAVTANDLRVNYIQGSTSEIHELARYGVRPDALHQCLAAIHEFVAYVRASEPGALRYEVWQEAEHPTRFVHIFVWKKQVDANAAFRRVQHRRR